MITENQINRLREYKRQLGALGYAPFQIRNIIEDEIGVIVLDNINKEQYEKLVRVFDAYILFAKNCRAIK